MNLYQFNEFFNQLKSHSPNIKIAYKNESLFMKFLGTLLFFNKEFMNSFVTTIGDTIYFPNREFIENNTSESIVMLAHEYQHIVDNNYYGKIKYSILYMLPQLFFIPLFAAGFVYWPFFIYSFLFLLPLPALHRTFFELRAYAASLFTIDLLCSLVIGIDKNNRKSILLKNADSYKELFMNMSYYKMCPFKDEVNHHFEKIIDYIINNNFQDNIKKDELYIIDSKTLQTIHDCLLPSINIKHL